MEPVNQAGFDLSLNERKTTGKENMIGKAIFKGTELLCPVSTSSPLAIAEQPELRAYKLGKQKCSYNQVELVIKDVGGGKITELKVSEAIETCVGSEVDELLRGSCLKFNVRFVNNNRMHLYIYVVYATPHGTSRTDNQSVIYHWIPVTRAKCRKSCKGPVIRGLQRFGRMPRRNAAGLDGEDSWKEPRHLYIAIDEASTHVCPRHETSKFRLLVAAYDDKNQLLGTTVSSSIRVLANNDAPLGAASFKLHCHIKGGWNTSTTESPIRNAGLTHRIHEKAGISRSPLQDIIQNSSPPKSYRSTTTDDTVKQADLASTHNSLLDIDLNKEIFDDSDQEGDENDMSETQPPHTGTTSDEAAANLKAEKEHSLTDLCERLLMACVAKQEYGQASVTLRLLANTLGARRKRILEIINVLETINVVQNQGKEKYLWLGSTQIARALLRLKDEGNSEEPNRILIRPAGRRPKSKGGNTIPKEIEDIKTDIHNPMRSLSKKFVQLFLIHEKSSHISWEQMLEYIVDGQGDDPETIRAKTRRLGEVARIFTALHLIKKVTSHKSQPSLVYEWLGSQGVAEHLVTLAELATSTSSKKVDGRRTRVNRTRSRSRSPKKQERKGLGAVQSTVCDSSRFNMIQVQQSIANMKSLQQNSISSPADHLKSGETSARGQHVTSKNADTDENAHVSRKLGVPRKKRVQRPFENISTNEAAAATTSVPIATLFRTSCGDLARSSAFKLCQSSLSGHIRGEIASQLDLSLSHQQSQFPNWKVQVEKLSTWGVRPVDSEPQCSSVDQEILQNSHEVAQPLNTSIAVEKDTHEVQVRDVSTSSEHATQGQASPDKTDAGSTTTGRSKRDNISYSRSDQGNGSFQGECSFKFTAVGGTAWRKWQKPIRVRAKDSYVSGSGTVTVPKAAGVPRNSANEVRATSGTSIPLDRTGVSNNASPPTAQQFPYKKRKFNYTSGDEGSSMCGETHSSPSREDDGRSGQVQAQSSRSLEDDGRSGQEQEHSPHPVEDDGQSGQTQAGLPEQAPDFDPIGNLLKYITPQMLLEIQALNSSFLYEYVKQARDLFNKQMAQRWTTASRVTFPAATAGGLNLSKDDERDRTT